MATSVFLRRLSQLVDLTDHDRRIVEDIQGATAEVHRGRDVLAVGDRPDHMYVVESGWAARYGLRRNGSRRITGFMLPGDFCGIHSVADMAMEHSIVAVTLCEIRRIRRPEIEKAISSSPVVGKAIWRAKLIDEATIRMWLLNSHNAEMAVAHLLCELHARIEAHLGESVTSFELPITQEHIADALGLTAVHVNRMMRRIADNGLIRYGDGEMVMQNPENLRQYCSFSPRYLHQGDRRGA